MNSIKEFLTSELAMPVIFLGFVIVTIIFLIVQSRQNSKARSSMLRDIARAQGSMFSNAAEEMATKLTEYTDTVLTEKVSANYEKLIAKDLLPGVNEAAKILTELSEKVTARQETGMAQLAERLAELFTEKSREYLNQEAVVIDSLQKSALEFSRRLEGINDMIEQLSNSYNKTFEQTHVVSASVISASQQLSKNMSDLGEMLNSIAQSVEQMHNNIMESGDMVSSITRAASDINKAAADSAEALTAQNERTAELLNNAVTRMQLNTEHSAKAVLAEFSSHLSETKTTIENTVTALRDISDNMNKTASQFSDGISAVFNNYDSTLEQKLNLFARTVADTTDAECRKIAAGVESSSDRFTRSIASLNETLEGHIANLQTITKHLGNSVDSFKHDVDVSKDHFELGMEKSVSDVLSEMDKSLAEIVNRLVSVTMSIGEAADALPKAVRSIKEST